jgi:hypothetical protein
MRQTQKATQFSWKNETRRSYKLKACSCKKRKSKTAFSKSRVKKTKNLSIKESILQAYNYFKLSG